MKRGIALILGLILATISSASVTTSINKPKCRESLLNIDASLSLTAQIEQDLLQGVWIQRAGDSFQEMAQFEESGVATFLQAVKMGSLHEGKRFAWTLEIVLEDPVLVLRSLNTGETYRLRVEQTCKGINLINLASGHLRSFDFVAADAAQQSRKRSALVGKWSNTTASVTLNNACIPEEDSKLKLDKVSFQFEFRKDGTFTRTLISRNADVYLVEEGAWEISKDGKQLLLHCRGNDGEMVTQCTKIKYLEMDEMVLEQPLVAVGKRFISIEEDADFFFNKF